MRTFIFYILLFLAQQQAYGQCNAYFLQPLSARPANYTIHATLDDAHKSIDATQVITFQNQSPEPIQELRIYMYLNAFKNTESTFLSGASNIFGQSFTDRTQDEWGWIEVDKITRENGTDLSANQYYAKSDSGSPNDQSVLVVPLDKPIAPGATAVFNLKWRSKMPKTIARAGYSRDFYLFCHWFPQLGVFEKSKSGIWGWNCHQFHRNNEFYADFGVYDVHITTENKFVMGASGCLVDEKNNNNGTITRHYHAEDIIDFAWSVYPKFTVQEDRWNDVQIQLLIAPEHAHLGKRYLKALKFALEYLEQHIGKYPYPTITVVDPPFHGLRSGLMEYPTLVTVGTFYAMPDQIRLPESLVVHEFTHQYFMGILASNEKEEPWMDEGFVTYFEDRIIDALYGPKNGLVDVMGYGFSNRELTRVEYTTMANPREGIIARPGWEFSESNFKALIYSKTATTLRTVEALMGTDKMDKMLRVYFERWKFKHPRGTDFLAVLQQELATSTDSITAHNTLALFNKGIFSTAILDYAVTRITNEQSIAPQGVFGQNATDLTYKDGSGATKLLSKVTVQRKGDWVFPVEVLVRFEDGSTQTLYWSGEDGMKIFEISAASPVVSAQIDPQRNISLDIDLNNNSLTLQPAAAPLWKYAAKVLFWIQQLFQTIGFLM